MKIVDLTLPMYSGMKVFPGDPEVSIERVLTVEKDEWNMNRLEINSHDGTHLNVPVHADNNGKTLDDYGLESFFGPAEIYSGTVPSGKGVLFRDQNIDRAIYEEIKKAKPLFIGLSDQFDFDLDLEKESLKDGFISYENLTNLDKLSGEFMFYGIPLKIREGDGSPVRAFAVIK